MAKGGEEKKPDIVEKYYDSLDDALAEVEQLNLDWTESYIEAVKQHLVPEGKTKADYKLLKKTEVQEKFAKTLEDSLVDKAIKHRESKGITGFDKDNHEHRAGLLRLHYGNLRPGNVRSLVGRHKEKYRLQAHQEFAKKNIIEPMTEHYLSSSEVLINPEHSDDILNYVGPNIKDYLREEVHKDTGLLGMLLQIRKKHGEQIRSVDVLKEHIEDENHPRYIHPKYLGHGHEERDEH